MSSSHEVVATSHTQQQMIDLASAAPSHVATILQTDLRRGLDPAEASRRLSVHGTNEFGTSAAVSWWHILVHQFVSSVVFLLIVAAIISVVLGEYVQASAIGVAILINAVIGFISESQAEVSLLRLKALAGNSIRAVRGGVELDVPVKDLVPGDVVRFEAGTRVPADIRLIESAALSVDESALTGESVCVFKESMPVAGGEVADTQLFSGTCILAGRGTGIVLYTGKASRLGKLGKLLGDTAVGATPLEIELDRLGRHLSWVTVALAIVIGIAGVTLGHAPWYMIQVAIALAVAAIPEGLQLLATLALAIGTQRMVTVGAVVRRLAAVETLGCTTTICTDKTGTLTENQLVVTDVVKYHDHLKVTGQGYKPVGSFMRSGEEISVQSSPVLKKILKAAMLCNDSILKIDDDSGEWSILGDPTEGALLVAGRKAGFEADSLASRLPRVFELPFDLRRKCMTTIHKDEDNFVAFIKGSPEMIFALSSQYINGNGISPMDPATVSYFSEQNSALAARGLRVLGVAMRDGVDSRNFAEAEHDLTFLGLIAMADRPKDGVKEAIRDAKQAGISVVMLTGDQAATGESIAAELGILVDETDEVVVGEELESADPAQLQSLLKNVRVIARATPELKLSVVQALQGAKNVVAMTGDGVNDAPALKQSNIGIAMGKNGSDLARDVSDLVLTDDNFRTIIRAIRQGRSIYQNIRQAVGYLLTASLAAVLTVAGAVLFDIGAHITPLQLLWLNLIMHIFPGLGMVLQPADPDVMTRPPRASNQRLFGRDQMWQIFMRSLIAGVSALSCTELSRQMHQSDATTSTVTLAALSLALMYQAWSWLFFAHGRLRLSRLNWPIVISMSCSYVLLFVALYVPALNTVLGTTPLTPTVLAVTMALVTMVWLLSEVGSFIHRRVKTLIAR